MLHSWDLGLSINRKKIDTSVLFHWGCYDIERDYMDEGIREESKTGMVDGFQVM